LGEWICYASVEKTGLSQVLYSTWRVYYQGNLDGSSGAGRYTNTFSKQLATGGPYYTEATTSALVTRGNRDVEVYVNQANNATLSGESDLVIFGVRQ